MNNLKVLNLVCFLGVVLLWMVVLGYEWYLIMCKYIWEFVYLVML